MSSGRSGSREVAGRGARGEAAPAPERQGRGPRIGPLRITPARVFLGLALLGGLGFLAYSLLLRDALQVPLMATGFAICGIVFGIAAAMSIGAVLRAGREGRDGTAVVTSLAGGLLAVGSMLSLAAAVIMAMIWRGPGAA